MGQLEIDKSRLRTVRNLMSKTPSEKYGGMYNVRGPRHYETAEVQGISSKDFTSLSNSLKTLSGVITYKAARLVSNIIIDLLSNSMPRVPVDTGELRRSGRGNIDLRGKYGKGYKTIVTGNKDGSVSVNISGVTKKWAKGATRVDALIQYIRTNESGQDVAVWCHENLEPFSSTSHPRARQTGTGPKYLEIPWLESKELYVKYLMGELSSDVLAKDIKKASKIVRGKKGRYTVDVTELVLDRIGTLGYKNIR